MAADDYAADVARLAAVAARVVRTAVAVGDGAAEVSRTLDDMAVATPDGDLREWSAVVALKRGCRR